MPTNFLAMVGELASALPPKTPDREAVVLGIYATLIGSLQLARAVNRSDLSDRILAAGANAAPVLAQSEERMWVEVGPVSGAQVSAA